MIEDRSKVPVFDFGGVAIAFSSRDERFMGLVHQRYGAFSTHETPALRITYMVDGKHAPRPRAIFEARQHPLGACRSGRHTTLDGGTFRGEWNRDAGEVEVRGPLATYPVDRLIEAMVYAVQDRVVILHAAALDFDGRGFVCSGRPGSGKSTIAGLFPKNALCDEHVAVRLDGQGALLSSLPFWRGRRGTTPLEAIYLLKHGKTNRRRRLSAGESAARLRSQVIWPTFGKDNLRRAFETFCGVIERVPVWELNFRPEQAVRSVLTGEAGE